MRRLRQVLVLMAGGATVCGAGPLVIPGGASAWAAAPARGVAPAAVVRTAAIRAAGSWGQAIEVPGLGALNKGGNAGVSSVSCTSAVNCVAGGSYRDGQRHYQGFVVGERYGWWWKAIEIPGLAALNKGGNAGVSKVSCTSLGNCAAGGSYRDGSGHQQGFVVSEKNGRWGQAIEVPSLGALNKGGNAGVGPVSCTTVGNCVAGGNYTDGSGHSQGFVVTEKNGRWGQALQIRGMGGIDSVSCPSAGNCSASGGTSVVSEKNGRWGPAIEVPGLQAWNDGTDQPMADVSSVSCSSPGNCTAGGDVGGPYSWAWVATEKNGVWGKAVGVTGLGALVSGRWASLGSVSCVSPGNCAAAGDYENVVPGNLVTGAFVAVQRNGLWDKATNVPGLGALNKIAGDDVNSVSCGSPGHCTAGGYYGAYYGQRPVQGFVT